MTWLLWEAAKSYTDPGSSLPSCLLQVSVENVVKFTSFERGDANHGWNPTNIKQIIKTSTISIHHPFRPKKKIHLPKSSQIPSFFQGTLLKPLGVVVSFLFGTSPWGSLTCTCARRNKDKSQSLHLTFSKGSNPSGNLAELFFPRFFSVFLGCVRECPCFWQVEKKTDRCLLRVV